MSEISLDLSDPTLKHIHILGIGGAGMSAIALVLSKMGKKVTGSDLKSSKVTERLTSAGIDVTVPHSEKNITSDIDCVVRSTAVRDDNEEVRAARELSISVLSRSDMLSAICAHEKCVGVAGSHGKTTTTSMVTAIARKAGLSPSFMIGGDVNEIGTNAEYHDGSLMIVEADESDRTFLSLDLAYAIVTNIESDHLENYDDSFEVLKNSFEQFIRGVDGPVVVCVDEHNAREIAERCSDRHIVTVGARDAEWTYVISETARTGISAEISRDGIPQGRLELAVPGEHNVRNALCALAIMNEAGVDVPTALAGLASFGGVARRFQFRGTTGGIIFIDDYAHLPSEISATVRAALTGEFSRVVAIFQPHRYSRTEALYKEFAASLQECDVVAICDVYSAGEEPRPGITGLLIVEEMKSRGYSSVHYVPHLHDAAQFVIDDARPGDVVLTLGAGDITMYADVIQESMSQVSTF